MKEREANRKYRLELFSAMLAYMVVLVGSIYLAKAMDPASARTLLLITPAIPMMLAVWAIARHFRAWTNSCGCAVSKDSRSPRRSPPA